MATTVANLREVRYLKQRGKPWPDPYVYIGRPSKWGNPYVVTDFMPREEAIALFREDAESGRPPYDDLSELRGKILVCWCKPEACHGDVLAELADR
jgi:hypothetical protein